MSNLHLKYRPKNINSLIGQEEAVNVVQGWLDQNTISQAIALTGPSGCGKTTIARILRRKLGCHREDFAEENMGKEGGVSKVRELLDDKMNLAAYGKCKVYLLDECHRLTTAGQDALLKHLEEPPPHVYFMLATTDYSKILPTIRTRCAEVRVKPVADQMMITELLKPVLKKEGRAGRVSDRVLERIAEVSDGSPRMALVNLGKVIGLKGEENQLNAVLSDDVRKQAWDIVKGLLWQKIDWPKMAEILKGVDEDPEKIRRLILANAGNELLKSAAMTNKRSSEFVAKRASMIINVFQYDTYSGGMAALRNMVYTVLKK